MKILKGSIPVEVMYIYPDPSTTWTGALGNVENTYYIYPDGSTSTPRPSDWNSCTEERIGVKLVWPKCCEADDEKQLSLAKERVVGPRFTLEKKENKPISGLKVISYILDGPLVVTPDNLCFRISIPIFMEAVKTLGVGPDGMLPGEYIWARMGDEFMLVRVGSVFHTALLEANERSVMSPLPLEELKVGTIYETKSGKRSLFLGCVDFWDYEYFDVKNSYSLFSNRKFHKKQTLWFPIFPRHEHLLFDQKKLQEVLDSFWKNVVSRSPDLSSNVVTDENENEIYDTDFSLHDYAIVGKHKFVKKMMEGFDIPPDFVENLRSRAEEEWTWKTKKPTIKSLEDIPLYEVKDMKFTTLRLHGAPEPVITNPLLINVQRKLNKGISLFKKREQKKAKQP